MRPRGDLPHPAIGQPAADERARDGRGLPVERRGDAGLALADVELRLEDRGHPVAHDPPGQRRQREVEHEQHERRIAGQLAHRAGGRRTSGRDAVDGPRRIPEQQEQRHRVEDADQAAGFERPAPAERRVIGHIAAEAADDDADVDPHLVQADGAGSRVPGVKVRDERQRRGNVEGLADPHERARPQQLLVGRDVPGRPGDGRPDEQAAGDDVAAAVAVGDVAADRAQERVDPLEQRRGSRPSWPRARCRRCRASPRTSSTRASADRGS